MFARLRVLRHDDLLPGGSPKKPKSSSARVVAGHMVGQLRRPSKFRTRLVVFSFTVLIIICLFLGRRHAAELQLTAATISSYIPTSFAEVIAQYGEVEEDTRWDDDVVKNQSSITKKPKFHLLIPARKPTANLCKTLISAAILNYPPPTLVNYGQTGGAERPGADVVKNTLSFLHGKEAHEDDLILIVEEDAWFQLPAEVTINRFFHGMRDSSAKLEKYRRVNGSYTQRVLFGATKECLGSDQACSPIPQSPLPRDIYGFETDKQVEGKYNRPRFIGSSMVMGRVVDLRPIYKRASELLEFDGVGKQGSQYVFSRIFGEQEYSRSLMVPKKWWFSSSLSNVSLDHEYGIGLDYYSSVFQAMNNSAEDIRFVSFDHPSVIASPSQHSSFKTPIRLPLDLGLTPPPFSQHTVSAPNPDPPLTALDTISDSDSTTWKDISLVTNVIVPGSSVPASLNFHGRENLLDELWGQMWFTKNARALMRRYIRSPDGPIAASVASEGGDAWWDLRGGKGGVWTDRGEWLEWNEVCGTFDNVVFGDGKGQFGREREEDGGQKVVYKFGKVVAGKEPKLQEDFLVSVDAVGLEKNKDVKNGDIKEDKEDKKKGVSPPQ